MGLKATYNSHTGTFLIIGGILVLGLGYYIYSQGKASTPVAQANLPPQLTGSGDTSNQQLSVMATNIYNDNEGISWFAEHNEDYYNQALALDDNSFVQLYNIFNILYSAKISNRTLTQFIQSADAIPLTQWATTQQAFLDRLSSLNLQ